MTCYNGICRFTELLAEVKAAFMGEYGRACPISIDIDGTLADGYLLFISGGNSQIHQIVLRSDYVIIESLLIVFK